MIYKDEKITLDTDKIVGITLVGRNVIILLDNYTQEVSYGTVSDAVRAYNTMQESIDSKRVKYVNDSGVCFTM